MSTYPYNTLLSSIWFTCYAPILGRMIRSSCRFLMLLQVPASYQNPVLNWANHLPLTYRNQGEMSPSPNWEGPRLSRSWIHVPNSYEPLVWLVFKSYDSSHSHPQADCYVLQYFKHTFGDCITSRRHRKNYNQAVAKSLVKWWSPLANSPGFDHESVTSRHLAPTRGCWNPIRNLHPPMLEGWYQSFRVKLGMVYEVYGAICHIFPNPICWSKIWCFPPKWSQILQRELGRSSSIAGAFAKC